jgi:hypothetical protein
VIIILFFIKAKKIMHLNNKNKSRSVYQTKALILTCIYFRVLNDVSRYLDYRGYKCNYDQFIIGGSLDYNQNWLKN